MIYFKIYIMQTVSYQEKLKYQIRLGRRRPKCGPECMKRVIIKNPLLLNPNIIFADRVGSGNLRLPEVINTACRRAHSSHDTQKKRRNLRMQPVRSPDFFGAPRSSPHSTGHDRRPPPPHAGDCSRPISTPLPAPPAASSSICPPPLQLNGAAPGPSPSSLRPPGSGPFGGFDWRL